MTGARAWRQFWDGYTLDPARLSVFRFGLFGILFLDAFRFLARADRYGAGVVHVAQLSSMTPWLPTPSYGVFVGLYLCMAYLAVRVALGTPSRWPMIALSTLYIAANLWSQLDGYQHHYFLDWTFPLLCLVPWERADAAAARGARTAGLWALRLVLVQVSLLYLWTAVAKLDPIWMNGVTLHYYQQPWVRELGAQVAALAGRQPLELWAVLATSVIAQQLFLAFAIHVRVLRGLATLVGFAFHGLLLVWGFKAGLFSWYMFGMYSLILPDRWFDVLWAPGRRLAARLKRFDPSQLPQWALVFLPIAVGLIALVPVTAAPAAALAVAVFAAMLELQGPRDRGQRLATHVAACAAVLVVSASTPTIGELHARRAQTSARLGDDTAALEALSWRLALVPDDSDAYKNLGRLHERHKRLVEAIAAWEQASQLSPDDLQVWLSLVRTYDAAGRRSAALSAAERAIAVDPKSTVAARELSRLSTE